MGGAPEGAPFKSVVSEGNFRARDPAAIKTFSRAGLVLRVAGGVSGVEDGAINVGPELFGD